MQIFYLTSPYHAPTSSPPTVMTIGNFDGVHLGHQAMLTATVKKAQTLGQQSAVMIFEPQPKEFFAPSHAPARLMTLDEKCSRLAQFGVDKVWVAQFDHHFAQLTADDFCQLLKQLKVSHLVLGDDFRFGQGRQGDKSWLIKNGFNIDSLTSVLLDGKRVSSTDIRQELADGNLAHAQRLLGEDYHITGHVVHGDKIGRTLGFATANIALNRNRPALHGVFGVDVVLSSGRFLPTQGGLAGLRPKSLFGCANIGKRPSIDGVTHDWRLEVHLPNFDGDLYGQMLDVRFLCYLHGEKKYTSLDELKTGIGDDVAQLLTWRANHT